MGLIKGDTGAETITHREIRQIRFVLTVIDLETIISSSIYSTKIEPSAMFCGVYLT